jgi:hypothetical protein
MSTQNSSIILFVDEKNLGSVVQNAISRTGGSCTLQVVTGAPSRLVVVQPVYLEYVALSSTTAGTGGAREAES